jgi:hypothetical protein
VAATPAHWLPTFRAWFAWCPRSDPPANWLRLLAACLVLQRWVLEPIENWKLRTAVCDDVGDVVVRATVEEVLTHVLYRLSVRAGSRARILIPTRAHGPFGRLRSAPRRVQTFVKAWMSGVPPAFVVGEADSDFTLVNGSQIRILADGTDPTLPQRLDFDVLYCYLMGVEEMQHAIAVKSSSPAPIVLLCFGVPYGMPGDGHKLYQSRIRGRLIICHP